MPTKINGAWELYQALDRMPIAASHSIAEVGRAYQERGLAGVLEDAGARLAVLEHRFGTDALTLARPTKTTLDYHLRYADRSLTYAKWLTTEESRRAAAASAASSWIVYPDDPARPAEPAGAGASALASDVAALRAEVAELRARLEAVEQERR